MNIHQVVQTLNERSVSGQFEFGKRFHIPICYRQVVVED